MDAQFEKWFDGYCEKWPGLDSQRESIYEYCKDAWQARDPEITKLLGTVGELNKIINDVRQVLLTAGL